MQQAGLVNLLDNLRSTVRRKAGALEAWTASILLLWVVITIACWSL